MSDTTQAVGPNSVGLIPDQLLSNIKKGDCVLFLGADLPLGYEGAPPSRPELAQALAKQYDLPPDRSWPETVQGYLDRFGNGRGGLIAFLRNHLAGPDVRPGPTHHAIACAGFRAIVTAWYDELLEQALRDAGCRVTRVVRDRPQTDVQEGEREVVVVKLYGCLSDDESLVLSARDHKRLILVLGRKLEAVTGFFQKGPPLIIGFDLKDETPGFLLEVVLNDKVEQDSQVFAVWPKPLDATQTIWTGEDVCLIPAQTTLFLEQLPAVIFGVKGEIRVYRPPWKFLDYYTQKDTDIFCGRDAESQIVARLILSYRLFTLFGPSGAGKTSLLLAGVLPRLKAEGYQSVLVRVFDDPLLAIRKAVAEWVGRTADWNVGDNLRAFINAVLRTGTPTVEPASPPPQQENQPASDRARLRQVLVDRFTMEELRTLCFELYVDYDLLAGETKDGKARELIIYLESRNRLDELVPVGRRTRPDIAWDDLTCAETQQVVSDRLVVVLDQFEEFFLRLDPARHADFFRELADTLDKPERDVRFVLSLREDYLAHLAEARTFLPDVFANSIRLSVLDRDHARVAIAEPAARAGVTVEPELVDALVGAASLAHVGALRGAGGEGSSGDLVEADGRVPPTALQIVLDRLYREALPKGHNPKNPPPPGVRLTLAAYSAIHCMVGQGEEVREVQGAQAILAGYVNEGLERLPDLKREDDKTPLGADKELGREILKVMVTSQNTKSVVTHEELLAGLDEAGVIERSNSRDQGRVEDTRLGLERVRLVRSLEHNNVAYYELAHDHLAAAIAAWFSQEEMHIKVAREVMRSQMDNWLRTGKKLLISLEALTLIHERRANLRRLTQDELELILRSAMAANYEVPYWRDHAPAIVGKVEQELFDGLQSENRQAVSGLVALASPSIIKKLTGLVEADFADAPVTWVDHKGKKQSVRRTLLNLTALRQRQAVLALTKMVLPEATEALTQWTPPGMILIPAGPFTMGSTELSHEGPVHEVWLDAFWIDRYPVTNAQWAAFIASQTWERRELWTEAGWEWRQSKSPEPDEWDKNKRKLDHPVRYITWYAALAFARWAGKSLLSEAQWEKAARGTDGRRYPWGGEFDKSKCNTSASGEGDTTPVGKYSPRGDSPYGVVDMSGNVWEWCCNLNVPYPYKADDGRQVLEGTGSRVLRGGSFYYDEDYARATYRNSNTPNDEWNDDGFRCGVGGVAFPISLK